LIRLRALILLIDRSVDVGPDRVDFLITEDAVPRRHVVLSGGDRIDKPVVLVRPQAAQVERLAAARIAQLFAMTAGAALRVDDGAGSGIVPAPAFDEASARYPAKQPIGHNHRVRRGIGQLQFRNGPRIDASLHKKSGTNNQAESLLCVARRGIR
jgi:hypothetical protein